MYEMCVDNLIQLVAGVFVDNGMNDGGLLYGSAALLWACGEEADAPATLNSANNFIFPCPL
jgi:hypothetical protein